MAVDSLGFRYSAALRLRRRDSPGQREFPAHRPLRDRRDDDSPAFADDSYNVQLGGSTEQAVRVKLWGERV